jgi:hypothetical protein
MRFTIKLGAALTAAAIAAALGLAALSQSGPAAAQELPGGTWGPALAVNLTALLPTGAQFDGGSVQAVSCASPGNCAAIGTYYATTTAAEIPYPFVLSETGGTWGMPAAAPGITSTPNQGTVNATVSCAAPGECAATWTYDTNGGNHAYLIDESQGTWNRAQPVMIGTADNSLTGVSCPAAGNCTAVGSYVDGSTGSSLPFVMDSSDGTWGAPQEVQGVAGLSSPSPTGADLTSVSCTSAGNCVAGGYYSLSSTGNQLHMQPFLATETKGSWGQAQPVAGAAALASGGWANLWWVSCAGSGDCAAMGGYFEPSVGDDYTWVANESGGTWGPAQQLPAPATSDQTEGRSLSCSPQGYCAVAGAYTPPSVGRDKAFVATYANGTWTAQDVPGVVASQSMASTVSCGAQGYCTAGGFYYPPGSGWPKLFTADDVNGTWASAQDVAGITTGLSNINDLSCTTPGYCTVVGQNGNAPFTASEATAATITLRASAPTVTYGDEEAETLTATVASPAGGTPTGTVTVTDGGLAACQITLANGTGGCALPATAIPGGTDQLTATYTGDASYAAATSTATVTVAEATTTPVITVSPATVTFGTNYHAVVSVTVAPKFTGTPTGGVNVYLNGRAMCGTLLTDGKAACTVPTGQNAGRYTITASYSGDGNFTASTSAAQHLTVAREKTSTSLALSKTTITYRHETAEKLTATVSSPVPNRATGKVTVKAGRTTICVITLKTGSKSSGSCTLKATQLKPGTYHLTVSYPGDGNYAPSNSSSKSLKVAA